MEKQQRLKMYKDMVKIRCFEEKVRELYAQGKLPGFFHLYVGQEAIAVGACSVLRKDDYITSTHRGHGHIIAKGADLGKAMAELFSRATGYNKAKGGSLHLAVPELGILGANGIVGGGIPIATGAAFSAKYRNSGQVTLCFFGDGASAQGAFHEAVNLGAKLKLPVVYICENNLYGSVTYQPDVRNVENIADMASSYGISGVIVDGNDVEEVYNAVAEAVKKARNGEGPTIIECKTYRYYSHYLGEVDNYRPKEEIAEWRKKDPIVRYRSKLLNERWATEQELADIEADVKLELDRAVAFAESSPNPDICTAFEDVYAD